MNDSVQPKVEAIKRIPITLEECSAITQYPYPIKELKIAGIDLVQYHIVAENRHLLAGAEWLRNLLYKVCGTFLSVSLRTELPEAEAEIRFCETSPNEPDTCAALEYGYRVSGKTLVIFAGGAHSAILAANRLMQRMIGENENVHLESGETVRASERAGLPKTNGADFRIMTANILCEFPSWGPTTPVPQRAEILKAVLEGYAPDVAGLQEVTPSWYAYWEDIIGNGSTSDFAFIHPKTPEGLINYSPIIYRSSVFDVIEDDVQYFSLVGVSNIRLVTWAVLRQKSSGRLLAVFNTHWSWGAEQTHLPPEQLQFCELTEEADLVHRVKDKYHCPVFCVADYNCVQNTPNYFAFMEAAQVEDAKVLARKAGTLVTENGGYGKLGAYHNDKNIYDHIFVTPGMTIASFNTVLDCQSCHLSDHSPLYADIVYPQDEYFD